MISDSRNITATPLPVTPEQVGLLQTGLRQVGVEAIQDVDRLAAFLVDSQKAGEGSSLPPELASASQQLANLVLTAELNYTQALVNNGRTGELQARLASDYGLTHKLAVLIPLI